MNVLACLRWLPVVLRALGYISTAQAVADGYTHHGRYFGLPIWMTADAAPQVTCKWAPLDLLIPVVAWIEGTLRELFFPDREPGFQILMGPPITPASRAP